jgi:uncharacterized membrane protein YoaK (UPF0700 family)
MNPFFRDVRETLIPRPGGRHGPLPPLLVGLTFVTGLVDAFSYLVLGHVFVANMTGNVVFLGFALVRTPGFSIMASIVALVSFWSGAFVGGKVGVRFGQNRGAAPGDGHVPAGRPRGPGRDPGRGEREPGLGGYRYPLVLILALAMGIQNATARKLAVPDLTTTVLTLTITGIAADPSGPGGAGSSSGRRVVSVASMLVGALIGAVFVLHVAIVFPLVIALVLLVIIAITARVLGGRDDASWVQP